MAGVSFKNVARTALDDELSAAATTMKILGGDWHAFTRSVDFYCLLLGAERSEIVKVTGGTSPYYTIERGQEGTTAADWPRGTLCFQNTSAASFAAFVQYEAFRQGAYNPNGALTSLYFGEKFYQSDDEMWWKSIAAGSTEWRLIAGEVIIDDVEFTPDPGSYDAGQALEMEVLAAGADIYYTDDGTTPTKASTLYSSPFVMPNGSTTYKARAFGANRWETPSENITIGTYTITLNPWLNLSANVGSNVRAMFTYNGLLYCITGGRLLYEYNGDSSPGWTLRAPAPGTGSVILSPSPTVAITDTHIYWSDSVGLLRWHTGQGSWTRINGPDTSFEGAANYDNDYLFCSAYSGATHRCWSYDISGTSWNNEGAGSTSRIGINGQDNHVSGKAYLVGAGGQSYDYSPYRNMSYAATGTSIWSTCATGSYQYFCEQTGNLWRVDGTNSPVEVITSPFADGGFALALFWGGDFNDDFGRLYGISSAATYKNYIYTHTIGGAGEWTLFASPPSGIGTNYFTAATTYNNTIYCCCQTSGVTYKYVGEF